ncbi:hypothetical protein AAEX63_01840 [Luteococcus sp. H138]|uniref:hypothetical protein n=1 Tax=Luteococcus sp. H138 TaxID=3139404 RepID=UPI00313C6A25
MAGTIKGYLRHKYFFNGNLPYPGFDVKAVAGYTTEPQTAVELKLAKPKSAGWMADYESAKKAGIKGGVTIEGDIADSVGKGSNGNYYATVAFAPTSNGAPQARITECFTLVKKDGGNALISNVGDCSEIGD